MFLSIRSISLTTSTYASVADSAAILTSTLKRVADDSNIRDICIGIVFVVPGMRLGRQAAPRPSQDGRDLKYLVLPQSVFVRRGRRGTQVRKHEKKYVDT